MTQAVSEISVFQIRNYLTGKQYTLTPATNMAANPRALGSIARVCNEPAIYNLLFRERLGGLPYTEEDALKFIHWSSTGWEKQSHFVWVLVAPEGDICAAIDIKSGDREEAEIGYWASSAHRGVMTNCVGALLHYARSTGFKSLFARVRTTNAASIRVLENNRFSRDADWRDDNNMLNRFVISLVTQS